MTRTSWTAFLGAAAFAMGCFSSSGGGEGGAGAAAGASGLAGAGASGTSGTAGTGGAGTSGTAGAGGSGVGGSSGGGGGSGGCGICSVPACAPGEMPVQGPGDCCPSCGLVGGAGNGGDGAGGGTGGTGSHAPACDCPETPPTAGSACEPCSDLAACTYNDCVGAGRTVARCMIDKWQVETAACDATDCDGLSCGAQVCLLIQGQAAGDKRCADDPCEGSVLTCECAAVLCTGEFGADACRISGPNMVSCYATSSGCTPDGICPP